MTESFQEKILESCRHDLREIERCIKIKQRELSELLAEREKLKRLLSRYKTG